MTEEMMNVMENIPEEAVNDAINVVVDNSKNFAYGAGGFLIGSLLTAGVVTGVNWFVKKQKAKKAAAEAAECCEPPEANYGDSCEEDDNK